MLRLVIVQVYSDTTISDLTVPFTSWLIIGGMTTSGFHTPTPVQKAVIPRLLNGENLVMAASTGSGKTLAFTLPVIQTLISQEQQVSKKHSQLYIVLLWLMHLDAAK